MIVPSSRPKFWFTHHFFVIYFIGASLHGFAQLLEEAQFWVWAIVRILSDHGLNRVIGVARGARRGAVETREDERERRRAMARLIIII